MNYMLSGMDMFFEEKNSDKQSLFTKFNNEADKFRAWKTQTEFSLQLKDKKILEMSNLITNMKARLSETLNDKKSLNLILQQEEEHKQDIVAKNSSNREMCYELKNYISRLNSQLEKAETEKADLKANLEAYANIIEDLFSKYKLVLMDLEEKKEAAAFFTLQKQSENYDLIQQLNLTSLDFQNQIDNKNDKIFDMNSTIDNLHHDINELSSKLRNSEETRVKQLNELTTANDCLKQTLNSLTLHENKCIDLEKQISDFTTSKNLLELYITNINKEILAINQGKDELQNQFQDLENELKASTLTINEKITEIDSVKSQLHKILDDNRAMEVGKRELSEKLVGMETEIKGCKLSLHHSRMEFKTLHDEFSQKIIDISSLKEYLSVAENENKELQELSKIKNEEVISLLQIITQKEMSLCNKKYEHDALEQKYLEASEEKTKLDELLKNTRNEFESKLNFERVEFEENIQDKLDRISLLELEQKSQSHKIENLESEYQRNLKLMEDIAQNAKKMSEEKLEAEMLLSDVTARLHLERDDFHKELDYHQRHIDSLQQELSNTASNLAFSLSKCKTEYDHLLKMRNDEMSKLESNYNLEIESLKNEVVYYKNLSISRNRVGGKIISFVCSKSQECLSDSREKTDGSESVSYSDLTSWIDSDPVFGC